MVPAAALRASDHWILTPAFSNTVVVGRPLTHSRLSTRSFSDSHTRCCYRLRNRRHRVHRESAHDARYLEAHGDLRSHAYLRQWTFSNRRPFRGPIPCIRAEPYVSPLVQDGKVSRELADALAFDERFICVVQPKALAVLSADPDQSSSRRIANVEKDIRKGLKQLAGAMGNLRSRAPISTREDGTPITVSNRETSPAHAILVLSEMYFAVDWKAVASLVAEVTKSDAHRALFHVVDVQELATLSTGCEDSTVFSNRLIQRS